MLFIVKPQIYKLIDEYVAYRSERFPLVAGSQKATLYRFCKSMNLKHISEVREEHIAYFCGQELTEFYCQQSLKAIRALLWHAKIVGYKCLSYRMSTKEKLDRPMGRPRDLQLERELLNLKRGKGIHNYRDISEMLSLKLKRRVHTTTVFRIAKRLG